jgi:uncharacterized protein YdeI (YjbR/CyaY-like superfamily)
VTEDLANLRRAIQPMPDDVRESLERRGLTQAYSDRSAYQRNDYLAWIARAKREATRGKRIDQMLDEIASGGVYMDMRHRPSELDDHSLDTEGGAAYRWL